MDDTGQHLARLKTMAPSMRRAKKSAKAALSYSVLADALYWSDEIPQFDDTVADDLVRFLLRYRTTLVLGHPQKALEPYWNEALRQFPEWIGFDSCRRASSPELQKAHKQFKDRAMAELMGGVDP